MGELLLLSQILFNLNWGPWSSEAWFIRAQEESQNYFSTASARDPLFAWMLSRIRRELGRPDSFGSSAEAEWEGLKDAGFLFNKGARVLLTRWGSWFRAMSTWTLNWSRRSLVLLVYGIAMGYCNKGVSTFEARVWGQAFPPPAAAAFF